MDHRIRQIFTSKEMTSIRKALLLLVLIETSIHSLDKNIPKAFKALTSTKTKKIHMSPFLSGWKAGVDPTLSPPAMSHRLRIIHFDTNAETIKKWANVNLFVLDKDNEENPSLYDQALGKVKIVSNTESELVIKFGTDPIACTISIVNGRSGRSADSSQITIINFVIDTPINLLLEKYTSTKNEPTSLETYTDKHFFSDMFLNGFNVEKYRNTVYYLTDYLSFLTQYRFNLAHMDEFTQAEYSDFLMTFF